MAQDISKMETTAVEWLEITILSISVGRASVGRYKEMILKLIEQAKEMEKEQIEKAYASGSNNRLHNFINEQYYKETYGS